MGLFEPQIARKPNNYPWTKDFITAMWNGFWTPNVFSFTTDVQDYKTKLSKEEKEIVKRTLSAIAQIEVDVKTFWANLGNVLPHPSIKDLGSVMAHVETVHNIAYEKLLDVLKIDDIFEKNLSLPIMKGRVDYLKKYSKPFSADEKAQYVYALILFTLFVENVSLFSQFFIIKWFNRNDNVLKDTAHQVGYTIQEEQIHALVGTKLINTLRVEYPYLFTKELEDRIYHEAEEAFKAEEKIIDWMLGDYTREKNEVTKDNLNAKILKEFIKDRINESLDGIGYERIFEVDKEFVNKETLWFHEERKANMHTDFFHVKSHNYQKKHRDFDNEEI